MATTWGSLGSLRHALALKEASGEPTARTLCHLALDIGTSFWSATEGAADHAGRASGARALHANPQSAPTFVLTPPAGTARVSNFIQTLTQCLSQSLALSLTLTITLPVPPYSNLRHGAGLRWQRDARGRVGGGRRANSLRCFL